MTNWNPDPTVLGLQLRPDAAGLEVIETMGKGVRTRLASSVAETVNTVVINTPFGNATNDAIVACDIYPSADTAVRTGQQFFQYVPNGDVLNTTWQKNPGGATTNLWQNVDEDPVNPNLDDSIIEPTRVVGRSIRFNVNSAGFNSAKRIVNVSLRLRIFGGAVRASLVHVPSNVRTATLSTGSNMTSSPRLVDLNFGEICPWTNRPWRAADIQAFDDPAVACVAIARDDTSGGLVVPQIYACAIRVECWDEKRVAYGVATPNSADTVSFGIVKVADGTTGWAKPASGTFDFVVRPVRGMIDAPKPYVRMGWVEGEMPAGSGLFGSSVASVMGNGLVNTTGTLRPTRHTALVLGLASGFSVDGNEYATLSEFAPSMKQILVPPANQTYGAVAAIVKPPADVNTMQVLTFTVRRSSDNVVMGAGVTMTRAELTRFGERLRNGWWLIHRVLGAPAVLVGGTSYRIEVTGGADWRVATPTGKNEHGQAGYGGTAEYVDWFGQTGARDAAMTLATVPATLTGLAANAVAQPMVTPATDCPTFDQVPFARITWDGSGLGAAFARYEVERFDPVTNAWHLIAAPTDISVTMVDDHEARFGVETSYRVRQVRQDGTPSAWAGSVGTVALTLDPGEGVCGLWFSVNERPSLNLAYMDVYGSTPATRAWTFLDASTTTLTPYYQRDYQVAHRPTERRGVQFSRRLLVNAFSAARPSMRVFDRIRDLSVADVSAVCVRDHEGNRWWTAMAVADGEWTQPGDLAHVNVTLTEVADEPVALTASNVELGMPWEALSGAFGSDANGAFVVRTEGGYAVAGIDTGEPDGAVVATLSDPVTRTHSVALAFRIVDRDNFLYVRQNIDFNGLVFGQVVAGVKTEQSTTGVSGRLTVEFSGSSATGGTHVRVLRNGAAAPWVVTNPIFDGATRHGIAYMATNLPTNGARWDDWQFYEPGRGLGAPWQVLRGTWRMEGGKALQWASGGGGAGGGSTVVDTGYADGNVVAVVDGADGLRLVFRAIDADNYLAVQCSRTFGGWTLLQRLAGAETTLVSFPLVPAGDDLTVEVQFFGPRVRFRLNGAHRKFTGDQQTYTLTGDALTVFQAATKHGIAHGGNNGDGLFAGRWHDWWFRRHVHQGVAGSQLAVMPGTDPWIGRQRDVPQLPVPVLDGDDTVALMWGINDAIVVEPNVYAAALEAVISRMRAAPFVVPAEIGVVTFTGTWSIVNATDRNEGTGWRQTTQVGATASFTLPPEYDGWPLVSAWIGRNPTDKGGTVSVTVDGQPAGSFSTQLWAGWTYNTQFVHRLTGLAPGSHTIVYTVTSVAGTVDMDAMWYEAASPRIAVANVARILQGADFYPTSSTTTTVTLDGANWTPNLFAGEQVRIYQGPGAITDRVVASNTADTITTTAPFPSAPVPGASRIKVGQAGSPWGMVTDGKVEAMNAALVPMVAQFPNAVLVDIDAALAKNPAMFTGDKLHPSIAGAEAMAGAFVAAIGPAVHRRVWIWGHSYSTGTGAGTQGFDAQLLRRLAMPDSVRDDYARPDDRGVVITDDFDRLV